MRLPVSTGCGVRVHAGQRRMRLAQHRAQCVGNLQKPLRTRKNRVKLAGSAVRVLSEAPGSRRERDRRALAHATCRRQMALRLRNVFDDPGPECSKGVLRVVIALRQHEGATELQSQLIQHRQCTMHRAPQHTPAL